MTTVKERRIQIARDVLVKEFERFGITVPKKHRPDIYAEAVAQHVVEALFPDTLLDSLELPDE